MSKIEKDYFSNEHDQDLWDSFKSGEKHAYEMIYNLHSDSLYKYGMHLCQDSNLVEDVIHDLFIYIWDHRLDLSSVKSIRLYLKFCLRRNLFKVLKGNRFITDEELLKNSDFKFSVEEVNHEKEEELRNEKEHSIVNALNLLSPRQKEIIYLRFYQSMSYDEIANHLSLEVGYTYNVASRAFAKIKSILELKIISLIFFALFS